MVEGNEVEERLQRSPKRAWCTGGGSEAACKLVRRLGTSRRE